MVAAIPAASPNTTASAASTSPGPKNPSLPDDPHNPSRPPLIPSEKDNAAAISRRPRTKEISSRYLSSHSSSSSTTSTSYSSSNSYSSSRSSSSSRRFPSPLVSSRPSTPPALAPKRSQSVDRSRPSTPRPDPRPTPAEPSAAARALCTTTRSLSVSFQGESFFYQTSHAKATSPSLARMPSPTHRRTNSAATTLARASDQSENSRPITPCVPGRWGRRRGKERERERWGRRGRWATRTWKMAATTTMSGHDGSGHDGSGR